MKLPNGYGSVTKLSGKRRKPYMVRKTTGWHYDEKKDKQVQDYDIIGYAETKAEGLQMLAEYNSSPYDVDAAKTTFAEIYHKWSKEKFPHVSASSVTSYSAAFSTCESLHNRRFADIKLADLQHLIDTCDKNYPTMRKIKSLLKQLYDYAMKYDIVSKDYSEYVDIAKYHGRNPGKYDRHKFSRKEIDLLWEFQDDKNCQTILMLIYTGVRVSELLELKKEDVYLDEQYFDVIASKTENGIRKVPIADKILPFFRWWYEDGKSDYLLHKEDDSKFLYDNYYKHHFVPIMKHFGLEHTPHCCRHTCISMLAEAKVDQTTIKKIVGHSGAMTLAEKVYTHLDVKELVDAINMI